MIGILTFQRAINYGAALQAYAMKETVSSFADAEMIDYHSPFIKNATYAAETNKLKKLLKKLYFHTRDLKFKKFVNEMVSKAKYNKETLPLSHYDKIIVGSDQVWNYSCSGRDDTFLLPDFKHKKYSYAASFGTPTLEESLVPVYKNALSQYNYISVREKTGQTICNQQLDLQAEVVLDPTLLLSKNDWQQKLRLKPSKQKYILVYAMCISDEMKAAAEKISKALHLPIYTISINARNRFGTKSFQSAGPKDFVNLFYNADFVITDSFHGTAFSVNFNKPFYSFIYTNLSSRISDLLGTLGISERLNPSLDDVNASPIDFLSVNEKLSEQRKKSLAYIEKIVND